MNVESEAKINDGLAVNNSEGNKKNVRKCKSKDPGLRIVQISHDDKKSQDNKAFVDKAFIKTDTKVNVKTKVKDIERNKVQRKETIISPNKLKKETYFG